MIKNDLLDNDVLPLMFNSISEVKMSIKHSGTEIHSIMNPVSPLLLFSTVLERLAGSPFIAAWLVLLGLHGLYSLLGAEWQQRGLIPTEEKSCSVKSVEVKIEFRYSEANRRTVKHEMGNRREIIVQYYESLRPGITILRHSQTTA
jgi:hypothetical protein